MPSPAAPILSIVLSTYNRADTLQRALASLLALDPDSPAHEIVVVDNNSRDHTREAVEALIPASDGRLRYVFEPRQGLSHARNRGVAASRGRYVAFTDDDVAVSPGWARALVRAFEAHPEASFVGGIVRPRWPSEPPAWLTRENWGPLALVDYGPEGFATSVDRPVTLVGANMACRREVFDEFGGFDPHYQHESGAVSSIEDHEFELRLYRAGRTGWYEPSAVVEAEVQPHRLTRAYHRKWHYDHGRGLVRLLPDGHVYDQRMLPRPVGPGDRQLLGVPLYVYKAAGARVLALARATLSGRAGAAVRAECALFEVLGSVRLFAAARRDPSIRGGTRPRPRIEDYAAASPPTVGAAG